MTILQGGYVAAKTCTSGPTIGCKNLTSWYLAAYEDGTNLGIFNCRDVRGGTTTSVHGEGRASDLGTPVENDWSWGMVEFLRLNSKELGIQCIIHRRKIWSCSGGLGWRDYDGLADHFDHAHVELTWAAANGGLTVALLNETYGANPTEEDDMFTDEDRKALKAIRDWSYWYMTPDDNPSTPVNEAAPNSQGEGFKRIRDVANAMGTFDGRLRSLEQKLDEVIAQLGQR